MRLIDADVLIEALGLDQHNNGEGMTSDEEWIAEAIMAAPTIEAEPVRRGRWKTFYHGDNNFSFACNKCYTPNWWKTRYCPGCGAQMEEQE